MREAVLTASPIASYCDRSGRPTAPTTTSPVCRPMPNCTTTSPRAARAALSCAMLARIASAERAAARAPFVGSLIAPKIAMTPSPVNLSRMPPLSRTQRAMTRRYALTAAIVCSGVSRSASEVEPRRSVKRIVTVCRSPSSRSGSPWITRSTTVAGRKRSRPRRRSSSRTSAPIARTTATSMSPWYSDRGREHLRTQPSLEPRRERRVADREEHRGHREGELGGHPEDELRRRLAITLLEHARCGEAVHREDRGHTREAEGDEKRAVLADTERRSGDEKGDQRGHDGDVRRDDEVLEPDDDRLVVRWIAQVPRQEDSREEGRDHDGKRPNRRRPHAGDASCEGVRRRRRRARSSAGA